MKSLGYFALILMWAAFSSANVCKSVDRLQAVSQSYKIDAKQALYSLLRACPPVGTALDENLEYKILNEDLKPGVKLLNSRTGEFSFEPTDDFVGITTFYYKVSDSHGRISRPAKITIHTRSDPNVPLLEVHNVTSVEGTYVPLGVQVSLGVDSSEGARLKVSLCDCDQELVCNKETMTCDCMLNLPAGWVLADGLERQYENEELRDLDAAAQLNLTLKTQLHSHAVLCLDVHALHWNPNMESQPVSFVKRKLVVNVTTSTPTTIPGRATDEPLQLETKEGQVIQFGGLRVRDSDDIKGIYRVAVSVDHGGMLSVKQDERSNVIFYPKESDRPEWEPLDEQKEYQQLDRFENFYEHYEAHNTPSNNNLKQRLIFVGSLESVNHVLSSMVFVPWCPQWPTPPNWNIPESSWMDPSSIDEMLSDEPLKPAIWPQWYPRFWYPFPQKTWTWWPRVLPPWWLNRTCSDWTSRIHVETREITPETCDAENVESDASHWIADVHVKTSNSEPKSLITDNLFTYFPANARSFFMKNLYLRSREEFFQLRIDLDVVEKELATIRSTSTNRPSLCCSNVAECTEKLQTIEITLRDGVPVQDVCKISVEIRMYKDNSEKLSDYMMLWGYKTVSECVNYLHYDSATTITTPSEPVIVRQGESNIPLGITYSSLRMEPSGILHAKIYAEHGLVSLTAQDGLRVYMDHIGRHERIPTYLCLAGPADMVIPALLTAKFTPFKNFKGETSVKVDYRMPITAMKETFGLDLPPPPMKRVTVDVLVVNGERPVLPLLLMPTKVCISEMNLLPLDLMRIEGRYKEDEIVSMSLLSSKGQLLLEEQRIPEIFECPVQNPSIDDEQALCTEECSYHTACPGTQMCCYQGCSRVCMEPVKVATVRSLNSKNVYMHGKISTLNRLLEAENMWYLAKPCQIDDAGTIVTDRLIETEQDTIRVEIVPARNPEGDSVLRNFSVDITCNPPVQKPDSQDETDSEDCTEVWKEWLDCQLEEGVCGRGSQIRQGRCGVQELVQERPCMVCGCKPLEEVITSPGALITGCTLDNTVLRCPEGCDVEVFHQEERTFSCPDSTNSVGQKTIEVHDVCICSRCLTHRK